VKFVFEQAKLHLRYTLMHFILYLLFVFLVLCLPDHTAALQSCRNLFHVCRTIGLAHDDNVSDLSNICQTYLFQLWNIYQVAMSGIGSDTKVAYIGPFLFLSGGQVGPAVFDTSAL